VPLANADRKVPVMMLHGMCCTGEMWANFRAFFEARGASVHTPTLRPELRTRERPPKELANLAFSDYVDDLEAQAQGLMAETGERPAVIGHSMGGLLAQALAERGRVSAAVFISPSAPAGARTPSTSFFWAGMRIGRALGLAPSAIMPQAGMTDRMVFNVLPPEERPAALARMVHESGRAFADLGNYPIDESRIRVPVLTVAATQDRLVPAALVRVTGKKYARVGGELREYGEHGHWLPCEPGWEKPASDLFDWLDARV